MNQKLKKVIVISAAGLVLVGLAVYLFKKPKAKIQTQPSQPTIKPENMKPKMQAKVEILKNLIQMAKIN